MVQPGMQLKEGDNSVHDVYDFTSNLNYEANMGNAMWTGCHHSDTNQTPPLVS